MGLALVVLEVLTGLLVVGYVGINFAADLPVFLVGENLVLAVLYGVGLWGLVSGRAWACLYLSFLAAFNGGRVSRSIVSPRGEVGELALEHVPLLAVVMAVGLLAFRLAWAGGCGIDKVAGLGRVG